MKAYKRAHVCVCARARVVSVVYFMHSAVLCFSFPPISLDLWFGG